MRGPYWTGAATPSGKTAPVTVAQAPQRAAMGAVFGDLQGAWLGHIEDLSTDGRAVTVGVRQRCAAARTGGGVMIHNMVRALGPRQRRSLVARLAAAWPAGLAALASGAPLGSALLAQAVAGGRLAAGGAVKRRAPLELGDAVPQGRVLPLERGILPDERRGQGNSPGPIPGRALTTVVAKDEGSRRSCRHAKASSWAARSSCQRDSVTGPRHRRPIMAASTARRSPAGKAL